MFKIFKKRQPKLKYIYSPKPDITTYELTQLIPLLIPNPYRDIAKAIMFLSPECRRHLKVSNEVT